MTTPTPTTGTPSKSQLKRDRKKVIAELGAIDKALGKDATTDEVVVKPKRVRNALKRFGHGVTHTDLADIGKGIASVPAKVHLPKVQIVRETVEEPATGEVVDLPA